MTDPISPRAAKKDLRAPRLETDRLILRSHRPGDFRDCAAMWRQPPVIRYTLGSESPPERTWQRLLAYRGHWAWLGYGYWALECKSTGQYIGELGFADFHRELPVSVQGLPEIGWAVNVQSQGRGYATEAIRRVLEWGDARPGFHRTFCIIHRENQASAHLARKFGYTITVRAASDADPRMLLARTLSR